MLEKRKLPRHKCCAGVLGGQIQDLVKQYFGSLPPEEVYCIPKVIQLDQVYQYDEKGERIKFVFELPKEGEGKELSETALHVQRKKFDYWLARESGCKIVDQCTFKGCSADNDFVTINASLKQKEIQLKARYLVGADGWISRVRNSLAPSFRKTYKTSVVYQRYYKLKAMPLPMDAWYIFHDPKFNVIMAEFQVEDDMLRIGVVALKNQEPKQALDKFIDFIKETYGVRLGGLLRTEGCITTDMARTGNFNHGKGRVLLAGEAGGFAAIAGIDAALDTGYKAGLSIKEVYSDGTGLLDVYREKTAKIISHIGEVMGQLKHAATVK
jgi:flavin-dependent dehydrogenase